MNFNRQDIQWGPVALGWIVSVVAFIIIGLILGALGLLGTDSATADGTIGAGAFIGAMIVGFLAHAVGGYVAGRRAGVNGPLNGVMVAVFGLVVVIILSIIIGIFGAIFFSGQGSAGTPGFLGYASGSFISVLINFIFNALGGYVGGRVSGSTASSGGSGRPSRVR